MKAVMSSIAVHGRVTVQDRRLSSAAKVRGVRD